MRNVLCLLIVLYLTACIDTAAAGEDYLEARDLVQSCIILPLERIIERIQAVYPGRILEVGFEREDGHYVYEIELVDEKGRVWELEYDAESGELLERERED